ncbi:MAG: L,D-transpeptidase [Salaquimonas sp.]
MFTRIALSFVIAAGTFVGANSLSLSDAEARYFDINSGMWKEGEPVKRRLDQRKVPQKFKRRNVNIKTSQEPGTIIIHTDEKFLYYITGKNKAIRYGVGVGREGFGWNGEVAIKRKVEWPTWTPPAEMRERERAEGRELPASMEGGIENPLGARALYLYKGNQDTLYRIHGTNQPWSIGLNLSSGCIRMENKDVEHLYERAKIGTKVVVIGPGQSAAAYINPVNNPFARLFNGG